MNRTFAKICCAVLKEQEAITASKFFKLNNLVTIPEGYHPFPSRTRKLRPPGLRILLCGKVSRCQVTKGVHESHVLLYYINTTDAHECVKALDGLNECRGAMDGKERPR